MSIKVAVVMDAIQSITPQKDSTLAMMLEAQRREWSVSYLQVGDISIQENTPYAYTRGISVKDDPLSWYILGEEKTEALTDFDVILMRKDPPFNMEYIYSTYMLELAEDAGVLVLNKPESLRNTNEKLAITRFPQCCPPSLITVRRNEVMSFLELHRDIVIKPLGGMGGSAIFRLQQGDVNTNVALEVLTNDGRDHIMVQRYIPEIAQGDKRILLIDGQPVPFALARVPSEGEFRGNLAKGATGKAVPLTKHDHWICEQVGPALREQGLLFVGLDVIGDYLTEINVTSPTCIRELDTAENLNIAGLFLDCIERKLAKRR